MMQSLTVGRQDNVLPNASRSRGLALPRDSLPSSLSRSYTVVKAFCISWRKKVFRVNSSTEASRSLMLSGSRKGCCTQFLSSLAPKAVLVKFRVENKVPFSSLVRSDSTSSRFLLVHLSRTIAVLLWLTEMRRICSCPELGIF